MRTFILFTAILLVALQAKAEPVPPAADEALGQERSEEGGQFLDVSAPTDDESALQDPGERLQHARAMETPEEGFYGGRL